MRLATVAAGLFVASAIASQAVAQFQESVLVTASRLPIPPLRRVLVLEKDQLTKLPARDLAELLRLLPLGLARRGAWGVQPDLALRGATFEGVLVVVNGVPMNDPQTGHFHLDLGIPLWALERVEVLLGPSSAVWGSSAVGGVVAVTTVPAETARAQLEAGEHRLWHSTLSLPLSQGLSLVAERAVSAGFRKDTDFAINRGSLVWRQAFQRWNLDALLAAEGKQFGAWSFYSTRFPNQRERTAAASLVVDAGRDLAPSASLHLRAGARQHRDVYVLDKTRPGWYRNRHRTRQAFAQVELAGEHRGWHWSVGVDAQRELLASTRLGNHQRERFGSFAEAGKSFGPLKALLQLRQDWHGGGARVFSPGASVELALSSRSALAATYGEAFRLPSFTELYYVSPASVGNPNLAPERAKSVELAYRFWDEDWSWQVGIFQRRARDLVDWVRQDSGVFAATNYARADTRGIELEARRNAGPLPLVFSGCWLSSEIQVDPRRSAYALTHPRWEAAVHAFWQWGKIALSPALSYRKPQKAGGFALLELSMRYRMVAGLEWQLSADNLLDRKIQEIPGVPLPGRWVTLALRWEGKPLP